MNCVNTSGKFLINRLLNYFPSDDWGWNHKENINMSDIDKAIDNYVEETEHYNGSIQRTKEWHIGRILYFINHPKEIKDIKIENICGGDFVPTVPIIMDGYHRFIAAVYRCFCGEEDEIQCDYHGRKDIFDYLVGNTKHKPDVWMK